MINLKFHCLKDILFSVNISLKSTFFNFEITQLIVFLIFPILYYLIKNKFGNLCFFNFLFKLIISFSEHVNLLF